jgi:hypothetical protein
MKKMMLSLTLLSIMSMTPAGCLSLRAQETEPATSGQTLFPQKNRSGKWGYVDEQGTVVIPYQYRIATGFDSLAAVYGQRSTLAKLAQTDDSQWGFIDQTGKEVIPPEYDAIYYAYNFSCTDTAGREVILSELRSSIHFNSDMEANKARLELKYKLPLKSHTIIFGEGLAAVKLNQHWGYMDRKGREVIPFKYGWAGIFTKDGLAKVYSEGFGYIDKTGREVIPTKYDKLGDFSEDGLAPAMLNGKWGFIDKAGQEVIPFKYEQMEDVKETGTGTIIISYERPEDVNKNLFRVKLNGKWGFVDRSGREVTPCKYDAARSFKEGLAGAKLNGKWGFIDKAGQESIPFEYSKADDFENGRAKVTLNGKKLFIDPAGNETK